MTLLVGHASLVQSPGENFARRDKLFKNDLAKIAKAARRSLFARQPPRPPNFISSLLAIWESWRETGLLINFFYAALIKAGITRIVNRL
jgi:hypothetical protein